LKPVVVRHKTTNDLYQYFGQNRFKNLRTGVEGEVSDEVAQRCFAINLDATEILHYHPIVEDLIRTLNLKFDK
jgi:hypothetical protein